MQIETWPIERLIPYEKNARIIPQAAIDKVAASLKEFGWQQPIVVDTDGVMIVGHVRRLGAIQLGWTECPVHVARDLTAKQVKQYRLMDNRSHEEATWDEALLRFELGELEPLDLGLTGFELPEIDELLGRNAVGLTDEDDVPEVPERPVSLLGDLWVLGNHRLLCGDSTSIDAVERLMDGQKADMVFTDPPYGIAIVRGNKVGGGGDLKFGKVGADNWVDSKTYAEIANDESTDTARQFYQTCIAVGMKDLIIWGGNYFTDFLPPSPCWAIWDKQNTGNFADVEMAWTSYDKGAKLYSFLWNGLSRAGDRKTELSTRVHPTQKPVGLFAAIFKDFEFGSCFDGFLGSGSTLIACEKTDRSCFGMEMSPDYCDVIVRRWQDFTGKTAQLEDGQSFERVSEIRRCEREAERCRTEPGTTPSEQLGAIQGEVDWTIAKQMAEEEVV